MKISISAKGDPADEELEGLDEPSEDTPADEPSEDEPSEKKKKAPPAKKDKAPVKKVMTVQEAVKLLQKAKKKKYENTDKKIRGNKVGKKQFDGMDIGNRTAVKPILPNVWNIDGDGYKPRELTNLTDVGAAYTLPQATSSVIMNTSDWMKSIGAFGDYPTTFNPEYEDYWEQIQSDTPAGRVLQFLNYMHRHGIHPEKPRTNIRALYQMLLEGDLIPTFDLINKKMQELRCAANFKLAQLKVKKVKSGVSILYVLEPKSKRINVRALISDFSNVWYAGRSVPVAYSTFDKLSLVIRDDVMLHNAWYPIKRGETASFYGRTASKPECLVLRVDISAPTYGIDIETSTLRETHIQKLSKKYCKLSLWS